MDYKLDHIEEIVHFNHEFWLRFVKNHWTKRPLKIENPFSEKITDEATIFSALKEAGKSFKTKEHVNFGLWVDGHTAVNYGRLFAQDSDDNLENYLKRILSSGHDEFCYAQFNMQCYALDLWDAAKDFIKGLIEIVGIPAGELDTDIFLGCYKKTPRGIHTDAAETFMHVIKGPKTIALWPKEYFDDKYVAIAGEGLNKTILVDEIEPYMKDAIILKGNTGDMLYWPASYWHIGLHDYSVEAFDYSLAFNIGYFHFQKEDGIVRDMVNDLFDTLSREHMGATSIKNLLAIPPLEKITQKMLQTIIGSHQFLEELEQNWLKHASGFGFYELPRLCNKNGDTALSYRLRNKNDNVQLKKVGENYFLFTSGYGKIVEWDECLESAIFDLNAGRSTKKLSLEIKSLLLSWHSIVPVDIAKSI